MKTFHVENSELDNSLELVLVEWVDQIISNLIDR